MGDNYDALTINSTISEIELQKYNPNIYNHSLVAVQTGVISSDGSLEYKIVALNDKFTGGRQVINSDHVAIHNQIAYKTKINIASLTSGSSLSYSFKTPSNKYVHFKNIYASVLGASIRVEILRSTSATPLSVTVDNGTIIQSHNLNDNSTNTSSVVGRATPTYTGGVTWDSLELFADTTNQTVSSTSLTQCHDEELVMKPNTYYIIKVSNIHSSDTAISIFLSVFWYEEDYGT